MNTPPQNFGTYWASLPEETIDQMMATSRAEELKYTRYCPSLAVPPSMMPHAALETMRRHAIRERLQQKPPAELQARALEHCQRGSVQAPHGSFVDGSEYPGQHARAFP